MKPDFNAFTKYRLKALRALLNYYRCGLSKKKATYWLSYSIKYSAKAVACLDSYTADDVAKYKLTIDWQRVDRAYAHVQNVIKHTHNAEEIRNRRDKLNLTNYISGAFKTAEERVGMS